MSGLNNHEGSKPTTSASNGGAGIRMTGESLLRVVPMVLSVVALVVMLKNAVANDYGSVSYSDLSGFQYLIYANGACAAYSLLSALYITSVFRSSAATTAPSMSRRGAWTVFIFDQVVTYMILAAGSVSAEVVYLANKGDVAVTWSEACGSYGGFCKKATVSTGITFSVVGFYVILSLISSYRLFSKYDAPSISSTAASSYPGNKRDQEMAAAFPA
ncbi:hypothetical protein C5167_032254 [Papaver somniferum]|uniref:CASP-like protein n=1 Tax=Papaver somniferum TaxID=3469 RepID=A0A4Y7KB16_PAPSO|nr:CASP-like protein 2A1 [Papaver somniferum]RZC69165.1 hypothetical protein C5167_032254 [Papaver somniferum]